jgi:chromosome partitioning protein
VLPLLDQMSGLGDVFFQRRSLHEVLTDTDMDNLKVIAESAELAAINDHLGQRNRREYWLKEKIVTPLSDQFDLIIFDCSPSWNLLATNALVSCDLLISPLECKITNFRNLPLFRALVDEFRRDLQLNFQQHFVPTRFRPQVRLSRDIKNWYEEHLPNVVTPAVKECALGEEAVATHQTMMEHAPSRQECLEMRQLIEKIYGALTNQSLGLGKATQIEFTEEHQKSHGESQWR